MKTASWLLLILANLATVVSAVDVLPGTQPLTWDGDIPLRMVDDLHTFADRETAASIERRARHWNRNFSSREAYEKSIAPNRLRLSKYLGVELHEPWTREDKERELLQRRGIGYIAESPRVLSETNSHRITIERFPVAPNLETVLLRAVASGFPSSNPCVIVLLDPAESIDQLLAWRDGQSVATTPIAPLQPPQRNTVAPLVQQLLARRCDVHVLRLLGREDRESIAGGGLRPTNQPHREFVYRQAFEMGRHVLGYELQAVLGIVDQVHRPQPREFGDRSGTEHISVIGYGEGGLLALLAGALDSRIDAVGVSGYFGPREGLAGEPIYRNIWGILDEFGDAELAAMIAPRKLIVEAAMPPVIPGPPPAEEKRKGAAPGAVPRFSVAKVKAELARAQQLIRSTDPAWDFVRLCVGGDEDGGGFGDKFLAALAGSPPAEQIRPQGYGGLDGNEVERFLFDQMVRHTQALVRESEYVRKEWWKNADRTSRDPEKWQASCEPYRKHLYDEVLGRFDHKKLPPNARTRKIYDESTYTGYEVVLDVFSNESEHIGVWAYGILLVPKNIPPGERRPVVVCQHGLEGRPQDTIEADVPGERFYHQFAAKLAERGFITFSPQNPYIGKDHFRQLVRKLWPLKKTLWSFIVPQHEQITDWLASLEFVDPARIGFYGLSYGGKTAMRVPALVDRYCLSICSGDFNEWIRKITSVRDPFSYMGTHEYEIMEFDLGHTFNYAEMAGLIAPRPFMVERGHRDGVGIDEWVAYEYAKVQLLYADLKIPERTEIEYFDGPHTIHGVGTFDFLHRHLNWPAPK